MSRMRATLSSPLSVDGEDLGSVKTRSARRGEIECFVTDAPSSRGLAGKHQQPVTWGRDDGAQHHDPSSSHPMHPETISRRYALLRAEINRQMSSSQKWRSLPTMLDQLHTLRTQYLAAKRSLDLLTEDSEKLAFRQVLH